MATIRLRASGRFQVIVRKAGLPAISKTFDTYLEADVWTRAIEQGLDLPEAESNKYPKASKSPTLGDALRLYSERVTPLKKGANQEKTLIQRLQHHPISAIRLDRIRGMHLSRYRDLRLGSGISGNTVRIELALISHLFSIAVTDWGFDRLENPVKTMRKPKLSRGRDRRFKSGEEERLLACCEANGKRWLKLTIIVAVETAMRRGELVSLKWQDVDLNERMVYLGDTKNGESRVVPLSKKAVAALRSIKENPDIFPWTTSGVQPLPRTYRFPKEYVFAVYRDTISNQFLDMCRRCGIVGLRFHDLRHEATSRLFEKGFKEMEASTITGHKSLAMLKRYTHLNPSRFLDRLDADILQDNRRGVPHDTANK